MSPPPPPPPPRTRPLPIQSSPTHRRPRRPPHPPPPTSSLPPLSASPGHLYARGDGASARVRPSSQPPPTIPRARAPREELLLCFCTPPPATTSHSLPEPADDALRRHGRSRPRPCSAPPRCKVPPCRSGAAEPKPRPSPSAADVCLLAMASPASSALRTELRLRQRVLPPSLFAVGLNRLQQHPHGVAPLGTRACSSSSLLQCAHQPGRSPPALRSGSVLRCSFNQGSIPRF
ncbi:formin-like protein 7 isoform X2 [Triticum aestivum]|uniref:formin-like protein 7 isoform X2 n=1 Tax=Triticum aestivum TaxID=4565 RepID=UPI001D035B44|nr:formin-like protein 7 isoform X2 [Triticum aestivum]